MIRLMTIAAVLFIAIPAEATILRFMPGDAFFHSRLTHEVVDSISDEGGTIVLPYRGPDHAILAGCGYAGFEKLEIQNVPPEISKGLKDFYRFSSDPRTEQITINADGEVIQRRELYAYRLIITVKEFEPGVQKFGLKYNENWHSPPPEAMKPDGRSTLNIPAAVYECYVKGQDAVALDWKDCPSVPAIPVTIEPYAAWGVTGAPIEQPAIVDASKVRFFILEDRNMRDYFRRRQDAAFWEIAPNGIRAHKYDRAGKLDKLDVPLDEVERAVNTFLLWLDHEVDAEENRAEQVTGPADRWLTE